MPSILSIPTEIIIAIAGSCDTAGVNNFSQTCRVLHFTLTPQLYKVIDLSSHNAEIECVPWRFTESPPGYIFPPDFMRRRYNEFDREIFQRQGLLERTFAANHSYGEHVRTLRWTILDTNEMDWGQNLESNSEIEDAEAKGAKVPVYTPEDEPIWIVFRSLTNVTDVDIHWHRRWREVTLPGPLFPAMRSLRLGGCMTQKFVSCILEPQTTSGSQQSLLERVELNNLFEWGKINLPLPHEDHLGDIIHFARDNADDTTEYYRNHLMIGVLDPLIGRLGNLRSLGIGTFGDDDRPRVPILQSYIHDGLVYASLARVLNSIRPTLEEFKFDQGINRIEESYIESDGWITRESYQRRDHRQMDCLFLDHILPVLLEAPWPRMKSLHIRGVGCAPSIKYPGMEKISFAVPTSEKQRLKTLLGGEQDMVDFVFEEEQGKDWECLDMMGTGIPGFR
ncbi:unnamed protein product [Periconia digitata]|uniref:Uncharacterized protein n=1 Tax=Periconia digitata TaxID=1303443 RepID=A0A9W4UJL1_9PLEO|nr:unnamed protein product [Periconia digitata]